MIYTVHCLKIFELIYGTFRYIGFYLKSSCPLSLCLSLQFECFRSLSLVFMKEGELKERQQQSSQMPFPFLAKSHHILPSHTSSLFFTQLFIKATLHPSLLHQRPSRLPPSTYHSFGFALFLSPFLLNHIRSLSVHPSIPSVTWLSESVCLSKETRNMPPGKLYAC